MTAPPMIDRLPSTAERLKATKSWEPISSAEAVLLVDEHAIGRAIIDALEDNDDPERFKVGRGPFQIDVVEHVIDTVYANLVATHAIDQEVFDPDALVSPWENEDFPLSNYLDRNKRVELEKVLAVAVNTWMAEITDEAGGYWPNSVISKSLEYADPTEVDRYSGYLGAALKAAYAGWLQQNLPLIPPKIEAWPSSVEGGPSRKDGHLPIDDILFFETCSPALERLMGAVAAQDDAMKNQALTRRLVAAFAADGLKPAFLSDDRVDWQAQIERMKQDIAAGTVPPRADGQPSPF